MGLGEVMSMLTSPGILTCHHMVSARMVSAAFMNGDWIPSIEAVSVLVSVQGIPYT